MADNVDITPGTGATVAADLVGGALYQRCKISVGADGSAADNDSTHPVYTSAVTAGYASVGSGGAAAGRTADTNAYTALDVIGAAVGSTAAWTFAGIAPAAGEIFITSAMLEIDKAAVLSGETTYTLYLYNITPPSAIGDNGPFTFGSGDRNSFLGFISLGAPVALGTGGTATVYGEVNQLYKQITTAGTAIYGYLVTTTGYTPASGTVYRITLHAIAV